MTTDFRKLAALLGFVALLVAGCVDKSNPNTLDQRSVERWNHLISHEAEKAYDYLTPGYRATQTREQYASAMNNRPIAWKKATFENKECDGDRCKVAVSVEYSLPVPGAPGKTSSAKSTQSETWLRIDGQWYYLPNG